MAAGAEVVEDSVKVALGYRLQKDSGSHSLRGLGTKRSFGAQWHLRQCRDLEIKACQDGRCSRQDGIAFFVCSAPRPASRAPYSARAGEDGSD